MAELLAEFVEWLVGLIDVVNRFVSRLSFTPKK
jgi:hypothetical protein